jgi:dipeptidyl aminopeptidase/acylaminoacyl peptidase
MRALVGLALILAAAAAVIASPAGSSAGGSTLRGWFANPRAFAGHGMLAFVSRGQLYVLDGETGAVRAVSPPGQVATGPGFSPDGDWLVYALASGRSVLARANGTEPHLLPKGAAGLGWLPDGRLVDGARLIRVAADGTPRVDGRTPTGLVAWAADGTRYAFVSRRLVHGPNGAFHGIEQLQVASTLEGPRTTWLTDPISFTRSSGFVGRAIDGVVVLPRDEGVLYRLDPAQSASLAADGLELLELRAADARPAELAVTLEATVSSARNGRLAIAAGGNREAWTGKHVERCDAASASCSAVAAPPGKLTLDPALSPDGSTLAFVEADVEPASTGFGQKEIERWYATRRLWLVRRGSRTRIAGTSGVAAPTWSADGRSLIFVEHDALWLIPGPGAAPEKLAGPLFAPGAWPSYNGQVDWRDQFGWSSG